MHEMWEALRDFEELKPHLTRRLAYILHELQGVERREEVEDIHFYLSVMKDLADDPESHATEQVRSYISKIHDILRKGPVPADFKQQTSAQGQVKENDGYDEWSPHAQKYKPKPAPWMEIVATSDFHSAGRGVGRGRGRDVGQGSGHGVRRGAFAHSAPTEPEVPWSEKEYYTRILEQNFERRQPARQQTNQEHFVEPPLMRPFQDRGYAEKSPQFYAQPQATTVPHPAVYYPPMIPTLAPAPYSNLQFYGPSPHFQAELSYAPSMGSRPPNDESNFSHRRWRNNSKRFSPSATPVSHVPVEYSAPVAPLLDQEMTRAHHNSSGHQVRRQVVPQAGVTVVTLGGPERSIIDPSNSTSTQSKEQKKEKDEECRPSQRHFTGGISASTTEVPSPPSSAGIRRSTLAKIPSQTPVVAGIPPEYRSPKICKRGLTSTGTSPEPSTSSRSVSDSFSSCSSSIVSSEGIPEVVMPNTEEVTSNTDPEKESSCGDPAPLPDAKRVSSIADAKRKKRATEENSEAIPYPRPSTSLQRKKNPPHKKSSGNKNEVQKLFADLKECNMNPLKLLMSTRCTRSGTLLGVAENPNESPEQPRARVPTPKKKTATPAKKDAGSSAKKEETINELARTAAFQKSPPATSPHPPAAEMDVPSSNSGSESEGEGESSELMKLVTKALEDKMKREQEENAREKRLQNQFVRHLDNKVVGPRDTAVNLQLNKTNVENDYILETVKQGHLVPQVEKEFDIPERLQIIEDSSQNVIYVNHEVDLDDDDV